MNKNIIDTILFEMSYRTKEGIIDFSIDEHIKILVDVCEELEIPKGAVIGILNNLHERTLVKNKESGSEYYVENPDDTKHIIVKQDDSDSTDEPTQGKEDNPENKKQDEPTKNTTERKNKISISDNELETIKSTYADVDFEQLDTKSKKTKYVASKMVSFVNGTLDKSHEFTKDELDFLESNMLFSLSSDSARFYYRPGTTSDNVKLFQSLDPNKPKYADAEVQIGLKYQMLKNLDKFTKEYPDVKLYAKDDKIAGKSVQITPEMLKSVTPPPATLKPTQLVSNMSQSSGDKIFNDNIQKYFKEIGVKDAKVCNGKIDTNNKATSVHALNELSKSINKSIVDGPYDDETKRYMEDFTSNISSILNDNDIKPEEKLNILNKKLPEIFKEGYDAASKKDSQEGNNFLKNIGEIYTYAYLLTAGEEVYLPIAGNFPVADVIRVKKDDTSGLIKIESVSVKAKRKGPAGAASSIPEMVNVMKRNASPEDAKTLDNIASISKAKSIDDLLEIGLNEKHKKELEIIGSADKIDNKNSANDFMKSIGFSPIEVKSTLGSIQKSIEKIPGGSYENVGPLLQTFVMRKWQRSTINQLFKETKNECDVDYAVVSISDKTNLDMKRYNVSDFESEEKSTLKVTKGSDGKIHGEFIQGNIACRPKHKK